MNVTRVKFCSSTPRDQKAFDKLPALQHFRVEEMLVDSSSADRPPRPSIYTQMPPSPMDLLDWSQPARLEYRRHRVGRCLVLDPWAKRSFSGALPIGLASGPDYRRAVWAI